MSVHLKYGAVHPRTLLADLAGPQPARASRPLRTELAWREFYADVLWHRPDSARENFDRKFDALPWDSGPAADEHFAAWAEGRTGFPIVDAGMRQLREMAWVHNRVRMIVASFLVKDLHLHWKRGARHFMRYLADGDLASNQHGWQWVAGTGTDAAPFFRVFNPVVAGGEVRPARRLRAPVRAGAARRARRGGAPAVGAARRPAERLPAARSSTTRRSAGRRWPGTSRSGAGSGLTADGLCRCGPLPFRRTRGGAA